MGRTLPFRRTPLDDTERRRYQGSRSAPTVSKLLGYSTAQVYDFPSGTDLGEVQVWNHFAVAKPPSGLADVAKTGAAIWTNNPKNL